MLPQQSVHSDPVSPDKELEVYRHASDEIPASVLRQALAVSSNAESVADIIMKAGRMAVSLRLPPSRDRSVSLRSTTSSRLESIVHHERFGRYVALVRRKMFGSAQAPFATDADAAAWIEQEYAVIRREPVVRKMKEEVVPFLRRLRQETGWGWQAGKIKPTLAYYADDGNVHRCLAKPDTPLGRLLVAVAGLRNATGFSEPSVTHWILVGVLPELSPAVVTTTIKVGVLSDPTVPEEVLRDENGDPFLSNAVDLYNRQQATITLHVAHVSDALLRALRRTLREEWKTEHKKPPTPRDVKLMLAVRKAGGPPTPFRQKAFWTDIARRSGSSSAKAAWTQYERLRARQDDPSLAGRRRTSTKSKP